MSADYKLGIAQSILVDATTTDVVECEHSFTSNLHTKI